MKYADQLAELKGTKGHLSSRKASLPFLKFTPSSFGGEDTILEVGEDYVIIGHASTSARCYIPLNLFVIEMPANI